MTKSYVVLISQPTFEIFKPSAFKSFYYETRTEDDLFVEHYFSGEKFAYITGVCFNETADTIIIGMTNATNKEIIIRSHLQIPNSTLKYACVSIPDAVQEERPDLDVTAQGTMVKQGPLITVNQKYQLYTE